MSNEKIQDAINKAKGKGGRSKTSIPKISTSEVDLIRYDGLINKIAEQVVPLVLGKVDIKIRLGVTEALFTPMTDDECWDELGDLGLHSNGYLLEAGEDEDAGSEEQQGDEWNG